MKKYDNFKDSGIEWLGEIPEHWMLDKLNRIFQINTGFTPSTGNNEFYENGQHDWITIRDLEGKYVSESKTKLTDIAVKGKTIIPKGSLLYSFKLSVGQMAFTTKDIYTNEAIFSIFPTEKLNLNYYYYLLDRVLIHNSNENIYGAKILNQELIKASKLLIPPATEQTQIANYLDHKTAQIDTLIAKKEQFIRLLQEERTAVINQAVTKGLDPNVSLKDSGTEWLGEIPKHWEVPKLKFVCEFILDGTHGSHPRVEVGYRLLSVRNIINGKFVFRDDDSCVSEEEYNNISSKFKIKKNDIQLAIVGATLGKVAIVDEMSEDFVTQRSLATIRSINSICIPNYLHNFMKSSTFQTYLWLNTGFSAQPGVYLGTLQNCTIPLPSISEQIEIVSSINNINNRIDSIISKSQQEIELLKEYKTALISEVVTGKVDVRDVVLN